jgi:hypothetical protein
MTWIEHVFSNALRCKQHRKYQVMKCLAAFTLLALGGCATCNQHPVWCAVGTAIVVGTVVAIAEQHSDQSTYRTVQRRFGYCTNPGNPLCHQ